MDLKEIVLEVRETLEEKRKELGLKFFEKNHIYHMKDENGVLKKSYPSVSKIIKYFFEPFDAPKKALQMSNGDPIKARELQEQWKLAGSNSTNMGSRVHYELEKELVGRYGGFKEVRCPIFHINEELEEKSDGMIVAGQDYINLMEERGAILLDTEAILGHPEPGYVGQADNVWLMKNKRSDDFGVVITDWKTNQPKNFERQYYTKQMFPPFDFLLDNALGHYTIQLPMYGRLLTTMLEGTKFAGKKMLGGVVVLLKDDSTFVEYRVPQRATDTVFSLDFKQYQKK